MPYQVRLKRRAQRQLDRLFGLDLERTLAALADLGHNPRPPGAKKLRAKAPAWRVRVGAFRIIYAVFDRDQLIVVGSIERRTERTYAEIDKLFQ